MSRQDDNPPEGPPPPSGDGGAGDGFNANEYLSTFPAEGWVKLMRDLRPHASQWISRYSWSVPRAAPTPEDMTSEAILRLLDQPDKWKPHVYQAHRSREGALLVYLRYVVRGRVKREWALSHNRLRGDHEVSNGDDERDRLSRLDQAADSAPSPLDRVEAAESEHLDRRKLDEMQQFCVHRGYGDEFYHYCRKGRKPAEIAKQMDEPVGRVYSRLARLREMLRRHFG